MQKTERCCERNVKRKKKHFSARHQVAHAGNGYYTFPKLTASSDDLASPLLRTGTHGTSSNNVNSDRPRTKFAMFALKVYVGVAKNKTQQKNTSSENRSGDIWFSSLMGIQKLHKVFAL